MSVERTYAVKGTARFIRVWGTGQVGTDVIEPGEVVTTEGSLAVVLERAEHLDQVRDTGLVAPETRVFVPGAYDSPDGPIVLGYDGSLSDPGGDVQIGTQFFLQTQDYGTSEYLSLIGATLVKVVDERDYEAFLVDADAALRNGGFSDFATHPMVRLCDAASLGAPIGTDGPRLRLYVAADRTISTSTTGTVLGEIGDDLAALDAQWNKINGESTHPCAVALSTVVPEDVRVAGLTERPWIARYHGAIAAIRSLRSRNLTDGRDVRVSGFGGRLVSELADVVEPWDMAQEEAPLLLWTPSAAYLYSAESERIFQVPAGASADVDRLLVHGSAEAAQSGDLDRLARIRDHFDAVGVPVCG